MDLTRPVRFRGLNLNTAASAGAGDPISGIALEQVLIGGAPGVGYVEKRSMADGYDASDVYLGRRVWRARATVYGLTRADLFDRVQDLMSCIHPTASYLDDVGAKGYLPLTYEVPTMDVDNWTEETADGIGLGYAYRTLQVYARPLGQPDQIIDRDRIGGSMNKGLAVPMQWAWDLIDPRVYVQEEQSVSLAGAGPFLNVAIENRGDYPTPVNILLIVPAGQPAGSVDFTIGTSSGFTITVPDSTEEQVIRYSARAKVLTVTEEAVETVRMDLLDLQGEDTHPQIMPGEGAFSMVLTGVTFDTDSRLFFNEAYA